MVTIEDRLRALEDRESIRHLKAVYAQYADGKYTDDHRRKPQGEIDELAWQQACLFTEEAVWDAGVQFGAVHGRQAIYEKFRSIAWEFALHFFVNPVITIDGDKAKASWMLWQPGTLTNGKQPVFFAAVTYDEYLRTPEGWKIERMNLTLKFITPFDKPWSANRNNPLAA